MILEGAVCFAVVPNAKANYALKSTSLYPAIVLERLRKEDVKLADGPLNLIEHMDISFLYRKNITRTICSSEYLNYHDIPIPHSLYMYMYMDT